MLLGTIMVWWIVVTQKIDLEVKIRRMLADLDKRHARVNENEVVEVEVTKLMMLMLKKKKLMFVCKNEFIKVIRIQFYNQMSLIL